MEFGVVIKEMRDI